MILYERKPTLVQAWKVPMWGRPADEPAPSWLIERMQAGDVYINRSGGLSANYVWGARGCAPGDYILLSEIGEIEFCATSHFDDFFHKVEQRQAA